MQTQVTEEQITTLAKTEIETDHTIGYIKLPKTEQFIKENITKDAPLSVWGLRTWSNPRKRSYSYLIVTIYPNTWREQFYKYKLSPVS